MRFFNTSGPCNPAKHYTVMRPALLSTGQGLVEQGRFFIIFALRQAGKTTYFQLLLPQLTVAGYTPIWVSFEGLKTLTRARFYTAFAHQLQREVQRVGLPLTVTLADQFDLELFVEAVKAAGHKLVLVIDEFEEIPNTVLNEVMHIFRRLYQQRGYHGLQALILVGISSLAELVLSSASPFNVVDELPIPYFTYTEVQELIDQFTAESGQSFDAAVVDAIYTNTAGQPGLFSKW